MGYKIVYDEPYHSEVAEGSGKHRLIGLTAFFLILFVLLTVTVWPVGREVLLEVFIPGDPDITLQALDEMILRMHSGEALGDAVWAFCKEIVNEAQIDF